MSRGTAERRANEAGSDDSVPKKNANASKKPKTPKNASSLPIPKPLRTFFRAGPTDAAKFALIKAFREVDTRPPTRILAHLYASGLAHGLAAGHAAAFLAQLGHQASAGRPLLVATGTGWALVSEPTATLPDGPCSTAVLYWTAAWASETPRIAQTPHLTLPVLQVAHFLGLAVAPVPARPAWTPAAPSRRSRPPMLESALHALFTEPQLVPSELETAEVRASGQALVRADFWKLIYTTHGRTLLLYPPSEPDADADTADPDRPVYYTDASTPFAWQRVTKQVATSLLQSWNHAGTAPTTALIPCSAVRRDRLLDACRARAPPPRTHSGLGARIGRLMGFVMALERASAEVDDFPVYVDPHCSALPPVEWGADGALWQPSAAPQAAPDPVSAAPDVCRAVQQMLTRFLLATDAFWLDPDAGTVTYEWCLTTRHVCFRPVMPTLTQALRQENPSYGALPPWECYDGETGRVRAQSYVAGQYLPLGDPDNPERVLLTRRRLFTHALQLACSPAPPAPLRAAREAPPHVHEYLRTLAGTCLWPQSRLHDELADMGSTTDLLARAGLLAAVPPAWWATTGDPTQARRLPPAFQVAFLTLLHELYVVQQLEHRAARWEVTWCDTPGGALPPVCEDSSTDGGLPPLPLRFDDTVPASARVPGRCPASLQHLLDGTSVWQPWARRYVVVLYGRGGFEHLVLRLDVRSPGSRTLVRLWAWAWDVSEWQPQSLSAVEARLRRGRTIATVTVPQ